MIGLPRLWDTVSMNLAHKKTCTPPKICHITPGQPPHNGHFLLSPLRGPGGVDSTVI